jgi:hypothetical protein
MEPPTKPVRHPAPLRSAFTCASCARHVDTSDRWSQPVWVLTGNADAWVACCGENCAARYKATIPSALTRRALDGGRAMFETI